MKKLVCDIFIILTSFFVSVLALFAGIKLYMYTTTKDQVYEIEKIQETYDYIIVPGAQIYKAKPSPVLQDRLDAAITLYQTGRSKKIVVSGAYEQRYQKYETEIMKQYLIENGIPTTQITEDRGGVTTYDTMIRFSQAKPDATAIITTQKMYSARTTYLAEKVGIKVVTAIADKNYETKGFLPYLREFLAPTKAFFYGELLKPNPQYNLDEIPFLESDELSFFLLWIVIYKKKNIKFF